MKQVTSEIVLDEGWITEKANDQVVVKYKYIPNTELISIKIEGVVDCPLINLLTLIYETELYNLWVPFLSQAEQLKIIHRASKVAYLRLGLPYPLSDREVYLGGIGVDRLDENGTILILAGSIDDNPEFIEKHKIQKLDIGKSSTVKVDVKFAGFEITPLSENKCLMKGVANVNPRIGFLPTRVINWFLRKAAGLLFWKISEKAKNIKGTAWEVNMQKDGNKDFYDWLRSRLDTVLKTKSVV